MVLISPQSQSSSWDVIHGGYGPDVQTMDKALQSVFERYTINPQQCSIGGFSDGASYALSVGTTNGDLFSHIIAFSPGFMRPAYLVSSCPPLCAGVICNSMDNAHPDMLACALYHQP